MEKQQDVQTFKSALDVIRKSTKKMLLVCIVILLLIPILVYINMGIGAKEQGSTMEKSIDVVVDDFSIAPFEKNEEGRMAEYGYRLITETYALVGPKTEMKITGNSLACSSCHLNAGTKPYAAPYVGLCGVFPTYSGRENKVGSLEERINGCLERSMDGRAIDVNSREMRAMISYMKHVSKDVKLGKRLEGQGFVDFQLPDRAADLEKGSLIYKNNCQSCHGEQGEGVYGVQGNKENGYIYPALWGSDTYNDGAGMARLITAAKFIKGNMPLGVTHDQPLLSDSEAYDVAAYINSHSRPVKSNKELDYPNLSKKPKDCPYPPYQDSVPQSQHRYGPFNFGT